MITPLFNFLARLPLPVLHGCGVALGWLVYALSSSYRRKFSDHINRALPSDFPGRRRVVRCAIGEAGKAILELPFLWGRSSADAAGPYTEICNWQVIDQAMSLGKGVVFLTPHMGSFESTAQVFSLHAPITVLYRPNRKPALEQIIRSSRARSNIALAPTTLGGVKELLKALRRGEAVGLLPDQVPSQGEGVWAPMFGCQAYTMTLPGRLQKATGAAIVLAIGVRKPWGRGFRLELFAGPSQLSDDPVQAAAQVNKCLEDLILRYPEQYYWAYERYKAPKNNSPKELPNVGNAD